MVRLVSWNMARRGAAWNGLDDVGADIGLLQEAGRPPDVRHVGMVPDAGGRWETALVAGVGPWRTAITPLTDRVELVPRVTETLETATSAADWVVSRHGSITAADVAVDGRTVFTAVSVYAAWETAANRGYADASAHRILSDLSMLLGRRDHPLIVAGDWNLLRGYGENANVYWKARYDTVFGRAESLGLRFIGPEYPNGRQADPWPAELPRDSLCVPTFHHSRQTPLTATRQLDFVFASASIADRIDVRAMNMPQDWGLSDHCRVVVDVHT